MATRSTVELDIKGGDQGQARGILEMPESAVPVPGVLLLHGFSSSKEQMGNTVGRGLIRRGVAWIAIDLPLPGARAAAFEGLSLRNPLALIRRWHLAVREAEASIRYLASHPNIDPKRIAIAGYSLGAYLALVVAAEDPTICAIALAAGGDLPPDTPFASLVRKVADPLHAVRQIAGRPLFMINGTRDRRVPPQQAKILFDAAEEPKEQRWYDGTHSPTPEAIEQVAEWLAGRLGALENSDQPRRTA